MKIEHNAVAQNVAREMLYLGDMQRMSDKVDAERAHLVERMRAQLVAVIDNRIDAMVQHLSDGDLETVVLDALDRLAEMKRDRFERRQNVKRFH